MAELKLQVHNNNSTCGLVLKAPAAHASRRKGLGFTSKCASLVKEQRTRIYILRRCATMLVCWYIHGDDH